MIDYSASIDSRLRSEILLRQTSEAILVSIIFNSPDIGLIGFILYRVTSEFNEKHMPAIVKRFGSHTRYYDESLLMHAHILIGRSQDMSNLTILMMDVTLREDTKTAIRNRLTQLDKEKTDDSHLHGGA